MLQEKGKKLYLNIKAVDQGEGSRWLYQGVKVMYWGTCNVCADKIYRLHIMEKGHCPSTIDR